MDLALTINCWFDENLMFAQQLGIRYVVAEAMLPDSREARWDARILRTLRNRVEQAGLVLVGLNHLPVSLANIALGADRRNQEIEAACRFIQDAGAAGIALVEHDWIAGGDAVAWDNLGYVLERVLPTAEQAGVRLACRATDQGSIACFRRMLDEFPSPAIGLDVGQALMPLAPIAHMAEDCRWLYADKRIFLVTLDDLMPHDTRPGEPNSVDDTARVLTLLRRCRELGYDGLIRPGRQPAVVNDTIWGHKAQAFAAGYLRALLQVLQGKSAPCCVA